MWRGVSNNRHKPGDFIVQSSAEEY
eukprot:COSAG02_NODE_26550_length_630_cov_1.442561_1_plen_24_part_01